MIILDIVREADPHSERFWETLSQCADLPSELVPIIYDDRHSEPMEPERAVEVYSWATRLQGWPVRSPFPLQLVEWVTCDTCDGRGQEIVLRCACRVHCSDCEIVEECRSCRGRGGAPAKK